MIAGRIWKRHALGIFFGAVLIVLLTPVVRLGILEYSFLRVGRLLDAKVPGVALSMLLRVEPWSGYHPHYQCRLNVEKIRCQVRLGWREEAFARAEQLASGSWPDVRPELDRWEQLLQPSYKGLVYVLERWPRHSKWVPADGYAVLREELMARGDTDATARLDQRMETLEAPAFEIPAAPVVRRPRTGSATPSSGVSSDGAAAAPGSPAGGASPESHLPVTERWGITHSPEARIYTLEGTYIRRLSPGKLLHIQGERQGNGIGRLLSCTTYPGGGTPFLIRVTDVETYEGDLASVDPATVDMLVTRISLEERIRQRLAQLEEEAKSQNPHHAGYVRARDEYRDFVAEAKRLTELRDSATGTTRINAGAKLTEMKGRGAALDRQYNEAKREYEAWNAAHGASSDHADDPRLMRLRREQREIEEKLQGIVTITR